MTNTGIIRRIDELGRVVIPKDIRRTLSIKEGDALEIHVSKGAVVLKKYKPVASADQWDVACRKFLTRELAECQRQNCHINFNSDGHTTVAVVRGGYSKYIGKARLNTDEDEYNPIIGQAIALCRGLYGNDANYMELIGLEG